MLTKAMNSFQAKNSIGESYWFMNLLVLLVYEPKKETTNMVNKTTTTKLMRKNYGRN